MSVSITLKNIPQNIYVGLKTAAKVHRRSLNSEVIACLERVLAPTVLSNDAQLAKARQIREKIKNASGGKKFKVADIEKAINQGRL